MNAPDNNDRLVSAWLELEAPPTAPDDLRIDIHRATALIRPRPAWLARLRRSPMDVITGGAGARRTVGLAPALLLMLLLLAIAAVAGFYIGSPRDQNLAVVPTASPTLSPTSNVDTSASVEGRFTACVRVNHPIKEGTDESGVTASVTIERKRGYTWSGGITATDPRFTGTHYYSWDANTYTFASGGSYEAWAEGHRIQNDGGAWQGPNVGVNLPDGSHGGVIKLTGEGGYAGLTALLFVVDGECFFNFEGIVGDVPEPPVPYTGG